MEKTLKELKQEFTSSSSRTKQYIDFHRLFKREFKAILKEHIKEIKI